MVFLSQQALERMKSYKYVSSPPAIFSRLMNWLLWEPCARNLPKSLAPNAITIVSSFCIVSMTALMLYTINFNLTEKPSMCYLVLAAFGYYFYNLLDILDGKQARNLGISSPLGQLLDHGLDGSVNTMSISLINIVMTGSTLPSEAYFTFLVIQTAFFWACWNEYHCGVLRYQLFGVGVQEFSHLNYVLLFLTYLNGYEMWNKIAFFDLTYKDVWMYYLVAAFLFLWTTLFTETVYKKGLSTIKYLIPLIQVYVSAYVLILSGIAGNDLLLMLLSCGFITGVLQVDHTIRNTTKESFQYIRFDTTLFLLASISIYYLRSEFSHRYMLLGILIPTFIYFTIITFGMMITISRYLDIPFFTIKKAKKT